MAIDYNQASTAYNDTRYNYDGTKQEDPPVVLPPSSFQNIKRVSPIMPAPILDSEGRPT